MSKSALNSVLIIILSSALAGCASNATTMNQNQRVAMQQAKQLIQMSENSSDQEAIHYRLQAIEQLILANNIEEAEKSLHTDFTEATLDQNNTSFKQILVAQLALAKQDIPHAKQNLRQIWTPAKLSNDLQSKFYATRAETYRRSGELADSVRDKVHLSKFLSPEEQKANNLAIWDILTQLTPASLQALHNKQVKNDFNGWLEFASITKQYDASQEQLLQALNSWRAQYPNHQAISLMPEYANKLQYVNTNNDTRIINNPKKIALMLPLQGTHGKAAQAIRDGFLAAFYANNQHNKTAVQVYDTSGDRNLDNVYRTAIADGAEFIVGPLTKEEVDAMSASIRPQVPILALNTTVRSEGQYNILQFGLSPELEAQAVAQKAWNDGHRTALVIIPKSAWGKRMLVAFQAAWANLGGRIVDVEEVTSQSNLTGGVKRLLSINQSEDRAQALKQLGIKFAFDPYRRQDVDMVFIATNAALARQVKPLLNFYFANNLPAYASSSVFSGKIQPNLDQDLNGIQFCDMPWILDTSINSKQTYKTVAELWPQDFDQYSRLYALGLDAFKVAMQIEQLTMMPDLGISGVTGMLTLDKQQTINRKLMWASFRKGIPQVGGE